MPSQITRIVKHDVGAGLLYGLEFAPIHKLGEKFAVMPDFILAAVPHILMLQSVEAMRAEGNDPLDAVFVQGRDIFLRQLLEEELVSDAACRIAATLFLAPKDGEFHARVLQQLGSSTCDLLVALIQGAAAPDPQQDFSIFAVAELRNV